MTYRPGPVPHLCDHAADTTGDTQGCAYWPACLRLDVTPPSLLHRLLQRLLHRPR